MRDGRPRCGAGDGLALPLWSLYSDNQDENLPTIRMRESPPLALLGRATPSLPRREAAKTGFSTATAYRIEADPTRRPLEPTTSGQILSTVTAVTNSCRACGLIVDIVPPFGSRNSEATMLAR